MKYWCTFLNDIHGIKLKTEQLFLSEDRGLVISNDENFLNDFYGPETLFIIGVAPYNTSMRLKTYIQTYFSVNKEGFMPDKVLSYLLRTCTVFSNALWLVKDNSVRFNVGHLKYVDEAVISIKSNFYYSLYKNSLGKKDVTEFSQEEVIKAISYFNFILQLEAPFAEGEINHAETNRIIRAFYFIDLARKNLDIGTKVSLHCSAFECLFSVSAAELRHRLSETIANYLGTDAQTRRKIYEDVKIIYDLRSTVTHGSGISKDLIKK